MRELTEKPGSDHQFIRALRSLDHMCANILFHIQNPLMCQVKYNKG